MDNFLDNLIYEIAIIGVLGSIFRQDNFLTIYERFWHLGGHVACHYYIRYSLRYSNTKKMSQEGTKRIQPPRQSLDDAYNPPGWL